MEANQLNDVENTTENLASTYNLRIDVYGGYNFPTYLYSNASASSSKYILYIYFCGTCYQSDPIPSSKEPSFSLLNKFFPVRKLVDGEMVPISTLGEVLDLEEVVHFLLIYVNIQNDYVLLSSRYIDFTKLIPGLVESQHFLVRIDLFGVNTESQCKIGTLDAKFELCPCLQGLDSEGILTKLCEREAKVAEKEKMFLTYSKIWWREYIDTRPENSERYVKLFAQDENGQIRPVVCYIKPINLKYFIESPSAAAWWVSLFKHRTAQPAGHIPHDSCLEQWSNFNTLITLKSGDIEDHAVLLCCLLLGFGLDAYVCLGTLRSNEPYAWVMTVGRCKRVTFWDPLNATRYPFQYPPSKCMKARHPFLTLGCIFNHNFFFANNQITDGVDVCKMNFCDRQRWKRMSVDAINLVDKLHPSVLRVYPPKSDGRQESCELEFHLRTLALEHRQEKLLCTLWNEDMSYVLSSAIALYELQGLMGSCGGESDILDSIHTTIPEGYNFRAIPIHFLHSNAKRIFQESLTSELCLDILNCAEDGCYHSVSARVYPYPQDVKSVWVMYGVAFKPEVPVAGCTKRDETEVIKE